MGFDCDGWRAHQAKPKCTYCGDAAEEPSQSILLLVLDLNMFATFTMSYAHGTAWNFGLISVEHLVFVSGV